MQFNGHVQFPEGVRLGNLTIPNVQELPTNSSPGELVMINDTIYVYLNNLWTVFRTIEAGSELLTGWRDIIADVEIKGSSSNSPTWAQYRDGIQAYRFSASGADEFWANFHINHDYKLGSPIHLHVHWSPNVVTTGVVRWGFEYTVAKGHQQETFPATTTVYVEQAAGAQYAHMVAEMVNGLTSSSFEPDTLILCRIFRDGSHVNDTCPHPVFALTVDCHYQSDRFATLNKSPNFYL